MCSNIRREEYKELSMAEPLLILGARRAASTGVLLSLTNRRDSDGRGASRRRRPEGGGGGPRWERGSGGAGPAHGTAPLRSLRRSPTCCCPPARPGHGGRSPSGGQECQHPSFQGRRRWSPRTDTAVKGSGKSRNQGGVKMPFLNSRGWPCRISRT